jgi:putative SOS response-associated peptidase YedK
MCGRFTNRYTWEQLHALYSLTDQDMLKSNFPPRYNIAPTQLSLVVRETGAKRELIEMRWGLLPPWAKSPGEGARMINARAETVATSGAYRAAFKARPCLVVADGFYEWKVVGPKVKQPYFITRADGRPFAFAGLWEPKTVAEQPTFTIVTTTPNEACIDVHDRMPVLLAPEDWPGWLGTPELRNGLMRPFPAAEMAMWPVGQTVGNVKNNGPELVDPIKLLA